MWVMLLRPDVLEERRELLRRLMWDEVGIVRSDCGLAAGSVRRRSGWRGKLKRCTAGTGSTPS